MSRKLSATFEEFAQAIDKALWSGEITLAELAKEKFYDYIAELEARSESLLTLQEEYSALEEERNILNMRVQELEEEVRALNAVLGLRDAEEK